MTIVDEAVLDTFRFRVKCEWCGKPSYTRKMHPHHLWARGLGGGSRLDIPINLIGLCPTIGTREGCHDRVHRGDILRCDLLAVVAQRENRTQDDIEREIYATLRAPKETT